ncbi:DUF418 domain-containing protein [Streptomyces ferrugineus]|uniref:DUF418 domain-containing protein n=1 Tax=Streptomyces ferrugineus TaxID=1413221 RepID=A0A7M2SA30_9ACTN|nr:DUF418 domain-containing protein [Streptomyces ferrugineus]
MGTLPLPLPGQAMAARSPGYAIAPSTAFGYLGLILVLPQWRGRAGCVAGCFAAAGCTALSCCTLPNVIALVVFSGQSFVEEPVDSVGTVVAWAAISAVSTPLRTACRADTAGA